MTSQKNIKKIITNNTAEKFSGFVYNLTPRKDFVSFSVLFSYVGAVKLVQVFIRLVFQS